MILLFPLSFRWIGYLQRKFKSKYFHAYVSLFLRCREGSRRERKGKINYLLFLTVQGTSAWRRKLIYSVIVPENGKERHPGPS